MQARTKVDWLMPSVADIMFLSLFFKLLSRGSNLLDDGDTGWHIVTGANILSTFKMPYADPYSFTVAGKPWTAHEWLAEVILALFHRWMGLNGVVLMAAAVITLTFFFLYLYMLRRGVSAVVAVSFTILAAWTSMLHWLARPHIFSFALTLAFIVILELYQRERKNYVMLLPLLMLFWVNLHGGYSFGLLLVFLYAGGNLLRAYTVPDDSEARSASRKLGLIAVLTLLASFVNPQGPAILYFPFQAARSKLVIDHVVEWLSPNFHEYRLLEYVLLLSIAILVISRKKPDIFEGSMALLTLYMSLYSVRFVPLLMIVVTPMVAARFGEALETVSRELMSLRIARATAKLAKEISRNVTSLESRFRHHFWIYASIGGCVLIGLGGGKIGDAVLMDYKHDPGRFPVAALDFAMNNKINGNMFNDDGWGGYIIYKSYPEYKVFMDGRSDMYGEDRVIEYIKVSQARLGYEEILSKYDVNWIIHNAAVPICPVLAASGRWKLVYADSTANILLKDSPENQELIEKYKDATFQPRDAGE